MRCVGVGGVAQAVADEVEGQHGDDDEQARNQQPRRLMADQCTGSAAAKAIHSGSRKLGVASLV